MRKKRIVIKLGTRVVTEASGEWNESFLGPLLALVAEWVTEGQEVLIVSSGAVGRGRHRLGLSGVAPVRDRQACAAVGQTDLMNFYQSRFTQHEQAVAQVLVSARDLLWRTSYLRLKECIESLLEKRVVPILNENDSVSVMELEGTESGFGDNDRLSAIVAAKLNADLLVICTSAGGLFEGHRRLDRVNSLSHLRSIREESVAGPSEGRGGLHSKLQAIQLAVMSGIPVVVGPGSGSLPSLDQLLSDAAADWGTLILPVDRLPEKKRWVASSSLTGAVFVNSGAIEALYRKSASLLPVGVQRVEGSFQLGQVIRILDERGQEWARGVTRLSSSDIEKVKSLRSSAAKDILGTNFSEELVHRDDLVLMGDPDEWKRN